MEAAAANVVLADVVGVSVVVVATVLFNVQF